MTRQSVTLATTIAAEDGLLADLFAGLRSCAVNVRKLAYMACFSAQLQGHCYIHLELEYAQDNPEQVSHIEQLQLRFHRLASSCNCHQ